MTTPMPEYAESIARGGIEYAVTVKEVRNGYQGNWTCPECGETGGSSQMCDTPEAAQQSARQGVAAHHRLMHPPEE